MRLQKNTSLALYSVLEFASNPTRHISGAEIADKYGVSPHHLAKVLAELARAGVVESVRGAGGGYRFIGNARRLTLMELTERTCKWPVGDPATDNFWFCGLPTQAGKPYCEAHVGVAFQPMSSRRDRKR